MKCLTSSTSSDSYGFPQRKTGILSTSIHSAGKCLFQQMLSCSSTARHGFVSSRSTHRKVLGMLNSIYRMAFAALLLAPLSAFAAEPIRPTEMIRLFDGKTLGDCYTFLQDTKREDPRRVFRVTDGLLHITGEGLGSLITNQEYRDYHVVFEFKWGDKVYAPRTDKT